MNWYKKGSELFSGVINTSSVLEIEVLKEYKDSKKKVTSFESNVLSTYNGSKGAKGKLQG